MSFVASAIAATVTIAGGVVQSNDAKAAGRKAGRAQSEATDQAIGEQRRTL